MHKAGWETKIKLLIPNNFTVAIAANIQSPAAHPTELRFSFPAHPPRKKNHTEDPINQEAKAQGAADATG